MAERQIALTAIAIVLQSIEVCIANQITLFGNAGQCIYEQRVL
jgi:hypothetical protein